MLLISSQPQVQLTRESSGFSAVGVAYKHGRIYLIHFPAPGNFHLGLTLLATCSDVARSLENRGYTQCNFNRQTVGLCSLYIEMRCYLSHNIVVKPLKIIKSISSYQDTGILRVTEPQPIVCIGTQAVIGQQRKNGWREFKCRQSMPTELRYVLCVWMDTPFEYETWTGGG